MAVGPHAVHNVGSVLLAEHGPTPESLQTLSGMADAGGFTFVDINGDPLASGVIANPNDFLYSTIDTALELKLAVDWTAQDQTIDPSSTASVSWVTVTGNLPSDFTTPITSTAVITRDLEDLSGGIAISPFVDVGDIFASSASVSGTLASGVAQAITFTPSGIPGIYGISLQFDPDIVREVKATVIASGTTNGVTISGGKPSGFTFDEVGTVWNIDRAAQREDISSGGLLAIDFETGKIVGPEADFDILCTSGNVVATSVDTDLLLPLDGSKSMTGVLKGIDPVASEDLTTKLYVDVTVGHLSNVIEDTSPELGGGLNAQDNTIFNALHVQADRLIAGNDPGQGASSPHFTFNVDTDSGMYRDGLNAIGFSAGGSSIVSINTTGMTMDVGTLTVSGVPVSLTDAVGIQNVVEDLTPELGGQLSAQTFNIIDVGVLATENGTVTNPSHSFVNNDNTGMFRPAANILGFSADGVLRAQVTISGIEVVDGGGITAASGTFTESLTISGTPIPLIFGADYQTAASDGDSTTTLSAFQTKTTLTTPALTGTYLVQFCCITENDGGSEHQVQLENITDTARVYGPSNWKVDAVSVLDHSGSGEVVFTGAAKTFEIQFNAVGGGTTTIRQARIFIWRVT